MKDYSMGMRGVVSSKRDRAARPVLEGLEERLLLYSVTGDHFVYGSRITWSIVPDGTYMGNVQSNLISTLNNQIGPNNWTQAFQDAFAQWESHGNINVAQVGDTGASTNTGGYQQGSNIMGDIRVGGYSQASNILAYTLLPPPNNGGSASGDIFINTSQNWHVNSDFDLETVLVHEIGHALAGLGHSTDQNAAMYANYNGIKQGLNQDDVNGMQSVWGPRAEDGFAAGNSNFSSGRAVDLTPYMNTSNNQTVIDPLDVASPAESYWFKFTTPANASSTLTIQIQSTYLSELSPKVLLYNASLVGLAQTAAATNSYGATINVSITNATPNTLYYFRVLGSNVGSTGTGAYGLTVNMGTSSIGLVAPPYTGLVAQADQGSGGIYETFGPADPKLKAASDHRAQVADSTVFDPTSFVKIPHRATPTHAASHQAKLNVHHPLSSFGLRRPASHHHQTTATGN